MRILNYNIIGLLVVLTLISCSSKDKRVKDITAIPGVYTVDESVDLVAYFDSIIVMVRVMMKTPTLAKYFSFVIWSRQSDLVRKFLC